MMVDDKPLVDQVAAPDSTVPKCKTCGHHHIQGIKCTICGHVGRSDLFQRMRDTAFRRRDFTVEWMDENAPNCNFLSGFWDLTVEIVRQTICIDLGIPIQAEIDIWEKQSRHFISYIGNAPCAAGRWRFVKLDTQEWETPQCVALCDRFVVLPTFRNKPTNDEEFGSETTRNQILANRGVLRENIYSASIGVLMNDIRAQQHTQPALLQGVLICPTGNDAATAARLALEGFGALRGACNAGPPPHPQGRLVFRYLQPL